MKLAYYELAYIILIGWLLWIITDNYLPKNYKQKYFLMVNITILLVMLVILLVPLRQLTLPQWLYSFFAEPAVLTVALIMAHSIQIISKKFILSRQNQTECKPYLWIRTLHGYLESHQFSGWLWLWLWLMVSAVIFDALALLPLFFYGNFGIYPPIMAHAIFAIFFVISGLLNTKLIWIGLFCLLMYICQIMSSQYILDYIADFWLFLVVSYHMVVISKNGLINLIKRH